MWQTNEVVKFDGKLYRILLVLLVKLFGSVLNQRLHSLNTFMN